MRDQLDGDCGACWAFCLIRLMLTNNAHSYHKDTTPWINASSFFRDFQKVYSLRCQKSARQPCQRKPCQMAYLPLRWICLYAHPMFPNLWLPWLRSMHSTQTNRKPSHRTCLDSMICLQIRKLSLASNSCSGWPNHCHNYSRTKLIFKNLITHLHQFVVESSITTDEWMNAIQFLTRVGKTCTPVRQEFIMLSDVLGVSTIVDAINNPVVEGVTESSNLGPFFTEDAPNSMYPSSYRFMEPRKIMYLQLI